MAIAANRGEFKMDDRDEATIIKNIYKSCDPLSNKYLKSEEGRFSTFPQHSLPYSLHTLTDLVRYGFFWQYDGSTLGRVKCVYCELVLTDFPVNALAAHEHIKGNATCPLLLYRNVENLRQPTTHSVCESLVHERKYHKSSSYIELGSVKYENEIALSQKHDVPNLHPRSVFSCLRRYASFKNQWQGLLHASDLAAYGFVFQSGPDRVKCEYCGLEIKNFKNTDLAAVEHFNRQDNCPFMSLVEKL